MSHGRVCAEKLLVRYIVVTEEALTMCFLATPTLSLSLAGVGQVACASWPCACRRVACKTPYSHRIGKQIVVPCDTDSFAVQNKGPAEVAQVACV